MNSLDSYYTPAEISEKMIAVVKTGNIVNIADFAAGNGALLKAGQNRWPNSKIIATDISAKAIKLLQQQQPKWQSEKCDFLTDSYRLCSRTLNCFKGKISLVLLNPPFSCKGASRFPVKLNNIELYCSLALAFVVNSIPYLVKGGQILAILPAGSLQSEKDNLAWRYLKNLGHVEVVGTNGHKSFKGCCAHTVIVHFNFTKPEKRIVLAQHKKTNIQINEANHEVNIFRGRVQMHSVKREPLKKCLPLIHTTNLKKDGTIDLNSNKIDLKNKFIYGPMILIPRVGKPNKSKILLYSEKKPIVISDCIIALQCASKKTASKVHSLIVSNWPLLKKKYNGTCAKYLTINSLTDFLLSLDISVISKN